MKLDGGSGIGEVMGRLDEGGEGEYGMFKPVSWYRDETGWVVWPYCFITLISRVYREPAHFKPAGFYRLGPVGCIIHRL